jgi:hypothetical protein
MKQEAAMARYNDDDDDDAFDENGLLKDGHKTRISLMMRDADALSSVQRAVAEDAVARRFGLRDSSELYAPGPRYCDAAGLERKAEAYRQMCTELQDAWKTPSAAPAAAAAPPLRRDTAPARPVYDAAEGRRIKQAAYDAMVAEMCSAWKGPAR